MVKAAPLSRDILGKSRYFRRDNNGLLYFYGRRDLYQVDHIRAKRILLGLSALNVLEIAILVLTLVLIFRDMYLAAVVFFIISMCLFEIFLRWQSLKWLSRDLTPCKEWPSSTSKQYWANEILLIDGVQLTILSIVFIILIGMGIYLVLHKDSLWGTLLIIFFTAANLIIAYRLMRMIRFKHSQQI